jgi:hypothetical protein
MVRSARIAFRSKHQTSPPRLGQATLSTPRASSPPRSAASPHLPRRPPLHHLDHRPHRLPELLAELPQPLKLRDGASEAAVCRRCAQGPGLRSALPRPPAPATPPRAPGGLGAGGGGREGAAYGRPPLVGDGAQRFVSPKTAEATSPDTAVRFAYARLLDEEERPALMPAPTREGPPPCGGPGEVDELGSNSCPGSLVLSAAL